MRDEYSRLIAFAERNLRTQIEKKQNPALFFPPVVFVLFLFRHPLN